MSGPGSEEALAEDWTADEAAVVVRQLRHYWLENTVLAGGAVGLRDRVAFDAGTFFAQSDEQILRCARLLALGDLGCGPGRFFAALELVAPLNPALRKRFARSANERFAAEREVPALRRRGQAALERLRGALSSLRDEHRRSGRIEESTARTYVEAARTLRAVLGAIPAGERPS